MKRTAPIILLALFSIIVPQQTLAATPIKVSAILVKTNDWEKPCSGGLFAVEIDLSQRRDKMYNCGIKTLISKKIEGTIQLQVLNNQTWEDFDQSNHWFPTSKSYFNSQNRLFSYQFYYICACVTSYNSLTMAQTTTVGNYNPMQLLCKKF